MLHAHSASPYSRAERVSDGVVHVLGVVLALGAVPVLITQTALFRPWSDTLAGVSVYGVTLLLMLTSSALCNMVDSARWSGLLQKLDHSAIYLKIAGTYTPFVFLSGVHVPGLLVGLWGSAALGSLLRIFAPGRLQWLALSLYLAMGWAVVLFGGAMLAAFPGQVLAFMAAGGVVYTVGVAFFLLKRLPFHTTIWHVFVLAGSALFFVALALSLATGTASDH